MTHLGVPMYCGQRVGVTCQDFSEWPPRLSAHRRAGERCWVGLGGRGLDRRVREPSGAGKLEPPASRAWVGGGSLARGADRGAAAVMNGFPGARQLCQTPQPQGAVSLPVRPRGPGTGCLCRPWFPGRCSQGVCTCGAGSGGQEESVRPCQPRGRWLSVQQEGTAWQPWGPPDPCPVSAWRCSVLPG